MQNLNNIMLKLGINKPALKPICAAIFWTKGNIQYICPDLNKTQFNEIIKDNKI